MKILIIGTGYVGLVSGACFADLGHNVVCVDTDENKIHQLIRGEMPFFEPELENLVKNNVAARRLSFDTKMNSHLPGAEIIFICVGTPPKENGQADLKYLFDVVEEIRKQLNHYAVIVTKSTVPVGTAKRIAKIISQNPAHCEFAVASCPEFLREGSAVHDFMHPDRIVIGTESSRATGLLMQLHEKFICSKVIANVETAEMIKYASNAFLATKISFINEIANICELVGADIEKVADGMGYDKRIGRAFLNAGIGYGGSCFPKDVRALNHVAGQFGYPFQLLKAVIDVNNNQRWRFYQKIIAHLGDLSSKKIAVWGVAFKPNTDDVRESIAIDFIDRLLDDGAIVHVADPKALASARNIFHDRINYHLNLNDSIVDVDAIILLTEWPEFRDFDFCSGGAIMRRKAVFDGRNFLSADALRRAGFEYYSIGVSNSIDEASSSDQLRVAVTIHPFGEGNNEPQQMLSDFKVFYNEQKRKYSHEEVRAALIKANPELIVAGTEKYDTGLLDCCPNLKMIARAGVGVDGVDLRECQKRGIIVTYTPAASTSAVAELTIGQMLNALRNVQHVSGTWERYIGGSLNSSTIGVFGCGRIGRAVIERLRGFSPKKILINDIVPELMSNLPNCVPATKEEILSQADIVTFHIPLIEPGLNPQYNNVNFITGADLAKCKKTAIIINAARGGIINEEDWVTWLKNNKDGKAVVDTYAVEPYNGELLSLPNAFLTPHLGSCTEESRRAMEVGAVEEILNFVNKKPFNHRIV